MRLLFDALSLEARPSGTRTRLLGLLPALGRLAPELGLGVLVGPGVRAGELPPGVAHLPLASPPRGPLGRRLREGGILRRALAGWPADLVAAECLPFPRRVPLLAVIHDLRHVRAGGLRGQLGTRWLGSALRRATIVHAVSRSVADEIAHVFPGARARVHVVPNGIDPERFHAAREPGDAAVLEARGIVPPYLLWVGHFEDRKDPATALAVHGALVGSGCDVPLVMVGSGRLLPESVLASLRGRPGSRRPDHVLRDVDAGELPALYRQATVVLATARLEGFGLVPLEAAACGAPVVATDIEAHREVLGEAAVFVPPADVTAFVDRVRELLDSETLREDLAARALERTGRFTWGAAAAAFLESLPDA